MGKKHSAVKALDKSLTRKSLLLQNNNDDSDKESFARQAEILPLKIHSSKSTLFLYKHQVNLRQLRITTQKMKFFIKDFFSKYEDSKAFRSFYEDSIIFEYFRLMNSFMTEFP